MIKHTKLAGLEYLYLGYLIHGSNKMRYKQRFRPLEVFIGNRWQDNHGG